MIFPFRGLSSGGLRAAGRIVQWLLTRSLYRLRVRDRDQVPARGGALLFSEHLSFADAFLISASLRRPVRHLLWRGYLQGGGPGRLARMLEVVPIAGTDPPRQFREAIEAAREVIRAGGLVCLYGEGLASRNGTSGGVREAMERLLSDTGAPVVPVAVDREWGGISRFRKGKFSWRRPPRLRLPVTVVFGKALP